MAQRGYSHRRYPAPPKVSGTCSVWKGDGYDYYAARGLGSVGQPWRNGVGTPLEDALSRLPVGARRVGSGKSARGTVVRAGSVSLSGIPEIEPIHVAVLVLAIGGILYFRK